LDIQELITLTDTDTTFMCMDSTSKHVRIEGNKRADSLAKEVTQLDSISTKTTVTLKQLNPFVTHYINKLWQIKWDQSPNSHYKQLHPKFLELQKRPIKTGKRRLK
jgi:hypothetical protein